MKSFSLRLLTSASLPVILFSLSAHAQQAPASGSGAVAGGSEEIIVTARRKAESLQDVPQTVIAVTSADIQRNNLLNITDISKTVSGLQIVGSNVSMRGITYDLNTGAAPTVAEYINEAPIQNGAFFYSNFDIGQIEVLRGPQGTVHGLASPSGAITLTTKRPDLENYGGYADMTFTTSDGRNFQGAVGVPLVRDKLAVRIAGVINQDDGAPGAAGVDSVHSDAKPYSKSAGIRGTILFEPSDDFKAVLSGQHLFFTSSSFTQVMGPGAPGGVNPNAPAGYNGPPLTAQQLLSVQDQPGLLKQNDNHITLQADWNVLNQRLSYVGSWQLNDSKIASPGSPPGDIGNSLLNYEIPGPVYLSPAVGHEWTHEFRIQSVDRLAGTFDYVLGVFHRSYHLPVNNDGGPVAYLPGAFPTVGGFSVPSAPNTAYQIDNILNIFLHEKETSFFGNTTAHFFDDKLEVAGGARYIIDDNGRSVGDSTTTALIALPPAFCPFAGGVVVGGACTIPGGLQLSQVQNSHKTPWIWDASIAYHFNPDLMLYGHAGSSFRDGPTSIGVNNPLDDPTLNKFIFLTPETSKSFEVGGKWSFLDRRALVSLAYYHQTFNGLIYSAGSVHYLDYASATATPSIASTPFYANVPAKVDGVEAEARIAVTHEWDVSGNVTYNNGRISNAVVPCNSGNFNGLPDTVSPTVQGFINAGQFVATCRTNSGSSTAPKWSGRLQSQYRRPIVDSLDGFVRGLLQYQSKANASLTYTVPAFALLDVYVGIADPSEKWEVAVFGKNITNNRTILTEGAGQYVTPGGLAATFGPTGYTQITVQRPREWGLNIRYKFGSD